MVGAGGMIVHERPLIDACSTVSRSSRSRLTDDRNPAEKAFAATTSRFALNEVFGLADPIHRGSVAVRRNHLSERRCLALLRQEASVARTLATRDIAARAGVNVPLLQYYFENKKGVYQTCAEHIANDAWMNFEPVVTHATEGLCHIRGGRVSSEQRWKLL